MMNQAQLFKKLRNFASRIRFEPSLSVGPFSIGLTTDEPRIAPFSKVLDRIIQLSPKAIDVFVVSAHNVDEISRVDRVGVDHECEAFDSPFRTPGGSGANTAYALARLGARIQVCGIVGDDPDGAMLLRELRDAGADTELILSDPTLPTGKTITIVERSGKRLIIVRPGVNNRFASRMQEGSLLANASRARIIHLSSFVGSKELRLQERLVQKIGSECLISMTPGSIYARQGLDRLESILRHVGIMFLYREQLVQLIQKSSVGGRFRTNETVDLLDLLFAWKKRHNLEDPLIVVVKDPLETSDGRLHQGFLSVGVGCGSLEKTITPEPLAQGMQLQAIDTTGAGDAAAAGFLFGLLHSASLESCIDFGFLLASFASTKLGARSAFSSAEDDPHQLPNRTPKLRDLN